MHLKRTAKQENKVLLGVLLLMGLYIAGAVLYSRVADPSWRNLWWALMFASALTTLAIGLHLSLSFRDLSETRLVRPRRGRFQITRFFRLPYAAPQTMEAAGVMRSKVRVKETRRRVASGPTAGGVLSILLGLMMLAVTLIFSAVPTLNLAGVVLLIIPLALGYFFLFLLIMRFLIDLRLTWLAVAWGAVGAGCAWYLLWSALVQRVLGLTNL